MIPVVLAGCVFALAAGTVAVLRRRYVLVTIEGESMLPTYRPGDRVLARRTGLAGLAVGSVVVFARPVGDARSDGAWMVKRVAGLPGDPVPEGWGALSDIRRGGRAGQDGDPAGSRVPPGYLLVLGDNPDASADSRTFGPVAARLVLGAVIREPSAPR